MAFTTPVNRVVAWGAVAATSASASTSITAGTTLVFFACAAKATGFPTTKPVITNSGTALTYVECGDVYLNDSVNPELRCTAYKAQVTANQTVTFTVTSTGSANVAAHATEFLTSEVGFSLTWATATNTQLTSTTDVSYTFGTAPGANDAVLVCCWENGTNNIALATGFTNLVGSTTGLTISTNKKMHVAYDITAPPATSGQWATNNARQVLLALTIPPLGTADAWNVNDKTTSATLSNTDKTMTSAGTGQSVRTTQAWPNQTTGKYYAEFLVNVRSGASSCALQSMTTAHGVFTENISLVLSTGNINAGGTFTGTTLGVAFSSGDVACLAWDSGTERVWFRQNGGLWNNDAAANPATGTNGVDVSATIGAVNTALLYRGQNLNDATTVRTEFAEYTQTVPSGFMSWMGETPPTANAWNLNDKSATITLSNSDKTATVTSATAAGVHSTTTQLNGTAGKYYAEFTYTQAPVYIGLHPTSSGLTSFTGMMVVSTVNGNLFIGTTNSGSIGAIPAVGDVICVAWDAGAKLFWFRLNGGSWNNSGSANPATGAGGINASATASTAYALYAQTDSNGDAVTLRTEAAELTQAGPSGFTSWMGEALTAPSGDITVNATGVAAGTALGTVVVDAVAPVSFEAVGVAAGTALGTAAATGKTNISTAATGVTATALTGTATASAIWNVSATSVGMTAGTALGTATAAGVASASTTPVGQTAATALGNVSVAAGGAVSVIPGGVTASAVTGTATASAGLNVNVTPTGVSAAAVTASGATAPSSSLIASFTPGPNRNDFTGEVGVRWGIGAADIPITWMGMYVTTTGGSRTVRLYEWFGDTVLRTVVFDFTGKTPGTWAWQPITPITLVAGGYYSALHSVTASDGLAWADALAPGAVTSVAGIVNTYATYRAGGAQTAYAPDIEYVGLDLGSGASGAGGVVVTIASTAQATGAAAATALGTATVTANRSAAVTPTGVAATTALGGVSIAVGGGISITPSSLAVTALSGTATVAAQQQVSTLAAGASATALSGTASVSVRTSTAATGVAAAALTGTATVTAKQAVSTAAVGVTASTALGGVSVAAGGSISIAAAGQSATALTGTATVTAKQFVSTAAAGVAAATAVGVVTVAGKAGVTATGQFATALVGTVTVTTTAVTADTVGVWTGTIWAQKPAKVWTGSAWMAKPVKTWNGGAWV